MVPNLALSRLSFGVQSDADYGVLESSSSSVLFNLGA